MNSILIVDGDKEYREFLVDFFKKREFDAVCCANYEQAWTLAAGKIFDIAVIDYFIGGQNGGALCEALTSSFPFGSTPRRFSSSNRSSWTTYTPWRLRFSKHATKKSCGPGTWHQYVDLTLPPPVLGRGGRIGIKDFRGTLWHHLQNHSTRC
jgi:hypothetical protein